MHFEEPTLNNFNHVYELYEESGSDNKKIEEIVKGENKKNLMERSYTNMDKGKEGKQADLLRKTKKTSRYSKNKEKMRMLWSPRKWPCQIWGKHFHR